MLFPKPLISSVFFLLQAGSVLASCTTDITLKHQVGESTYNDLPIEIISQNTVSVQLAIHQTWNDGGLKNAYIQYRSDVVGSETCVKAESFSTDGDDLELTVFCMKNSPVTLLNLYVSDDSFDAITDNAEIPKCCHADESDDSPKVEYTFVVQCESTCEEDDSDAEDRSNQAAVTLQTSTCPAPEESVYLSEDPHIGTGEGDDIELTVDITETVIYEENSGYQPQLVLFLAKPDTTIEDVTTDDNGWSYFESEVVSWMKAKIHCCLSTTYFYAKTLDGDTDSLVEQQANYGERMESSASMRLRRSGGFMTYWYQFEGTGWVQIGDAMELPEEYKAGPLKIGYRIKREWHCKSKITCTPSIVSGGPIPYTVAPGPSSYFAPGNSVYRNTVSFDSDVVTFSHDCGSGCSPEQSLLLSQEVFEDNVSLQVQITERQEFSSGYQAGLFMFFVPDTVSDISTINLHENSFGSFKDTTIGSVYDKFLFDTDYTYFYSSALQIDGSQYPGYAGDRYQNTAGYMRLERHRGYIQVFKSPNGDGWQAIGDEIELPDEWKTAGLRIGLGIKTNWKSQYYISFIPTIDTLSVDTSRIQSPTAAPTEYITHDAVVINREYDSSYFTIDNSLSTAVTSFDSDYVRFSSDLGSDHALLLSDESFSGSSLTLTVDVLYRQLFYEVYQAGLWVFFADPESDVQSLFATDDPCDWKSFQNATLALFGDKVHGDIVHTWMETNIVSSSDERVAQSGSVAWRNTEGSLRLQRIDGFVTASIREESTDSWTLIGDPVELPDEWKTAPVKLGIVLKENYGRDFQVAFSPTVDGSVDTDSRRGLRGNPNMA